MRRSTVLTGSVQVVCGCLGIVRPEGSRFSGEHVWVAVLVLRPCPGGHPQHLPRVGYKVTERWDPEYVTPYTAEDLSLIV